MEWFRRLRRVKKVQIYVKVDEMKTVGVEVSPKDKVQKILNTVSGSDWDVYATCEGRILRKDDEMKSCGVRDGMRGGGKHKDKRSKAEKKQVTNSKKPEQKSDEGSAIMDKDEVFRRLEEDAASNVCPKEVTEKCNRRCRATWRKSRNCRG